MNVKEFCQSLYTTLERFKDPSSEASLAPIFTRIQKFDAECSDGAYSRQAAVNALFDLSAYIQQQSSSKSVQFFSDTVTRLISAKIQEITIPLLCAGLRNTSNTCYAYGCLKGLWASKKFREIIERKAMAIEEKLLKQEAFAKLAIAICEVPAKDRASISTKPIVATMGEERSSSTKSPTSLSAVASFEKASQDCSAKRLTALFLHRLFLAFDATSSSEVIEPEGKVIHDVLQEMAKYHPSIAEGVQQDSTEFLQWLLEDIFESEEYLFSYVEENKRPQELAVDFCIPNIDIPETTRGNLFIIQLPNQENAQVDPQAAFEPIVVEEIIDPASVLSSDHNKEKDAGAMVSVLSKIPPKVHVLKTKVFQGEPPPCLFIHLWRQIKETDVPLETLKSEVEPETLATLQLTDEEMLKLFGRKQKVKVPVQVKVPKEIFIHHAVMPRIQYALKGVIVHTGLADSGHYYAYLPVGEKGPSSELTPFVLHNDLRVFAVPHDHKLEAELQQQGYILIYDRV